MQKFDNIEDYIADLKSKLSKNEGCGNTWYNLGVAYLSKREFMDAERAFLSSVSHSPKLAEGYVQLGGIALQRGDLDGCLNYNIQATKERPFFSVPWGNIGYVMMEKGEFDKAISSFKRALKYDPNFVQALATMGSAYIAIDDIEEAEKVLDKAISIQPMFGPAWNNLAIIYASREEWAKADEAVKKAEESHFDVKEDLKKQIADNL